MSAARGPSRCCWFVRVAGPMTPPRDERTRLNQRNAVNSGPPSSNTCAASALTPKRAAKDFHRTAQPLRDGFPQHGGTGLELIEAVGSPALQLHLDTFHMNIEEKSQAAAISQGRQARVTSTRAAVIAARREAITRIEGHRRRAQSRRLRGRCGHRIIHAGRESHRPRRGYLASDRAESRSDRAEGIKVSAPRLEMNLLFQCGVGTERKSRSTK